MKVHYVNIAELKWRNLHRRRAELRAELTEYFTGSLKNLPDLWLFVRRGDSDYRVVLMVPKY